ncbi:MAG: protein translocase subunit SecD [Phycisphaerales bacterium]|nr:protein translocase subunit SecD [Phycisphaerales bacterium]MCB9836349.1 protein translocase subunit SecD [Phycisphaera sp.]
MRHLVRNSCLVLALLVLMSAYIWPLNDTVRLGKDLRGGYSLTYGLQIDPSVNASEVMETTITVLKDRVDPQGTMDLSIVPQGRDRIEITMPVPNDKVKVLRAEFLAELDEIRSQEMTSRDLDRVLRLGGDEREAAIEQATKGHEGRRALIAKLIELSVQEREASERLRSATENGAPAEAIDTIVDEVAATSIQIDQVREELLTGVLSADRLQQILELPNETKYVLDTATKEPFPIPSQRQQALDDLKASIPGEAAKIDEVVKIYDNYHANRKSLDDPSDLIRLLQGSGVLEFRIVPSVGEHPEEQQLRQRLREEGPRLAGTRDARWFQIADPTSQVQSIQQANAMLADPSGYFASSGRPVVVEEFEGVMYILLWDTPRESLTQSPSQRSWRVSRAFETSDDSGRPAVGFRMDANGAVLLGNLTEANLNKPMAVLLDNKVYTWPNLIAKITSNGIITGIDSADERESIIRTLNAGTLTATLSPQPISQSILGPELGQDNLDAGLIAGVISLVAVSAFMIVYYFTAGAVAVFSLFCNALLIMGMVVLGNVTMTLPGIAGIILTFGMAVDANVLIFERIREEQRAGVDLRPAIRLGYSKALSSIVDGNVTNLIVCLVLANIGTQEIKGFAITLGIGVIGTMFSALVISRLIFGLMTEKFGKKHLKMLPTVMPVLERALEPKIDWLRLRGIFIVVSLCYVGLGVGMVVTQRSELLDTEFRGGTAITMRLKEGTDGERVTMTRLEVAERIAAIGKDADNDETQMLSNAEVLPINPEDDGVTSSTFRIKTLATNAETIAGLINAEFADVLPSKPRLSFAGSDNTDLRLAPVYPITRPRLGDNIERPTVLADVSDFNGGVAIVLNNLDPQPREQDLKERLDYMRRDREFSSLLSRQWDIRIIEGTPEAIQSAAVVVLDPGLLVFESRDRWEAEVAGREWDLVRRALSRTESLAGTDTFDAAVASSFRGKAITAVGISFLLITIYIWVRFGSVRYSLAALVALMHDVLTAIGLIALAEIMYHYPSTANFARALYILPFKIDLALIAALLTIIGYSLNDTIIIMDRIRENRGKLDYASRTVVNLAINQTISRTVITSGTTLAAVIILYIFGGEGVRAFSFTLLVGVIVGTYSSIAVAAPLVWSSKHDRSAKAELAEASPAKA